ncbi:MAG: radical SAM protein [Pseudomonadota bacterium]
MARIAFVQNLPFEYPGVCALAGVLLRAGHEVRLFVGMNTASLARRVAAWRPLIAGFPLMTGNQAWALRAARAIRGRWPAHVILGGVHPTFFPEIVREDGVDAVCRGEGEDALLTLAGRLERGEGVADIPNLWVKQGGVVHENPMAPLRQDLDALPAPDHGLYHRAAPRAQKIVMTTRGCPFSCTYCHNVGMRELTRGLGTWFRTRSVGSVMAELREIKARHHPRSMHFADDIFGTDVAWLREFSGRYRAEIGLPFYCMLHLHLVTEESARLLAEAGCFFVGVGIESGSERVRRELLHRPGRSEELVRAAGLLRDRGIALRTNNMVGLPGESLDEMLETLAINQRIQPRDAVCRFFTPYPGTALARYAVEHGFLDAGSVAAVPATFSKGSLLRSAHAREVRNLQKLFLPLVRARLPERATRRVLSMPPNPAFEASFFAQMAWHHLTSGERSLVGAAQDGLANLALWWM